MNRTTRRHSSAIATLASLALAATACKSNQTEGTAPPPTNVAPNPPPTAANDARPGAAVPGDTGGPPAAGIDPPAPPSSFQGTAQVLPQGEVAGWRQSGVVTPSTAANLSQLIDGAAALYQQYGVRSYAKTEYRRPGTTLITTVEVYEFAAPLGAFGYFTHDLADGRDPATMQPQGVNRGGGGYQGTTSLKFWKDRYFVTVSVSDASEEPDETATAAAAREAMPRFAEAIERGITGTGVPPVSPLPQEGLVWGGTLYYADQVFGVDQSGPAWVGYYLDTPGGGRYRLAVMPRDSAQAVAATFTRLRAAGATPVAGVGDEAFSVRNAQNGELVVMRKNLTVYVIADGGAPGLRPVPRDRAVGRLREIASPRVAPAPTAPAPSR